MPSRKTASDRIPDPRAALGRAAEDAAVRHLERLGYEIFARNVRLGGAEIDVIARDGDAIVFVEVRSRRASRARPRSTSPAPGGARHPPAST